MSKLERLAGFKYSASASSSKIVATDSMQPEQIPLGMEGSAWNRQGAVGKLA